MDHANQDNKNANNIVDALNKIWLARYPSGGTTSTLAY